MSIRASGLGKTPGIQATVKSGEKKMRDFGDAAAERAADEVTEPVAIFAKTASGLRQMPGDKMIKGLLRELRLNNLRVETYLHRGSPGRAGGLGIPRDHNNRYGGASNTFPDENIKRGMP